MDNVKGQVEKYFKKRLKIILDKNNITSDNQIFELSKTTNIPFGILKDYAASDKFGYSPKLEYMVILSNHFDTSVDYLCGSSSLNKKIDSKYVKKITDTIKNLDTKCNKFETEIVELRKKAESADGYINEYCELDDKYHKLEDVNAAIKSKFDIKSKELIKVEKDVLKLEKNVETLKDTLENKETDIKDYKDEIKELKSKVNKFETSNQLNKDNILKILKDLIDSYADSSFRITAKSIFIDIKKRLE